VIAVERSVTQIRQEQVYVAPKNHERRELNVDSRTVESLRAWRKVQVAERLTWGAGLPGCGGPGLHVG
jgi:integrase